MFPFRVELTPMYEKTGLADLETRDVEDIESDLKAVGYRLRPQQMRPIPRSDAERRTARSTNAR
jgi:hypothetical protein